VGAARTFASVERTSFCKAHSKAEQLGWAPERERAHGLEWVWLAEGSEITVVRSWLPEAAEHKQARAGISMPGTGKEGWQDKALQPVGSRGEEQKG
jgi:hypothetical protein